jgi:hypothetical protein
MREIDAPGPAELRASVRLRRYPHVRYTGEEEN